MSIVSVEFDTDDIEAPLVDVEMAQWWQEVDDEDKHMLLSLTIYAALGGKWNAFSVQETGVDLGV